MPLHTSTPTHKVRPPPFVHEDDEVEESAARDVDILSHDVHLSPSSQTFPLKERSPNASPTAKQTASRFPGDDRLTDIPSIPPEHRSQEELAANDLEETHKSDAQQAVKPPEDLSADLASLSRQLLSARRGSPSVDITQARRKNRKLGRALSSLSNRSASASAEMHAKTTSEYQDNQSTVDQAGHLTATTAPLLPSTQLGYETSEAEAHRLQMAKKMGTSFADDGGGRRVASIGVVKDSERITPGGMIRPRARHKAGR